MPIDTRYFELTESFNAPPQVEQAGAESRALGITIQRNTEHEHSSDGTRCVVDAGSDETRSASQLTHGP